MPEENLQKNDENKPKQPTIPGTSEGQTRRLKTLRTFQGDIDEALVRTKASVVSIAVAEQKRNVETEKKIEKENKTVSQIERKSFVSLTDNLKNKFFIYLGSILLVLAVAIIITIYYNYKSSNTAPQKINPSSTVINYTTEVDVDISSLNSNTLSVRILQEKKKFNLPVNSILYINTQKNNATASVSDTLNTLAPSIPAELVRNLADKYMIGIYSFDTNEPFIILTVNDFGLTYSGMLKWEGTIRNDLGQMFGLSLSTSSPFLDEALRNKDLRIIKNQAGKTVLLYSFIDKNTILITSNEKIFNAILAKYITGEMVR